MSFLDEVKGLASGQGTGNSTLDLVGGLIQKSGGVSGLVATLQRGGLGGLVESWVGNGANQPVSGQQLSQALQGSSADQQVTQVAQQQGVDKSQVYDQLAQHLPTAVDHVTPNGQVPAGGSGFNLSELSGLASKLGL